MNSKTKMIFGMAAVALVSAAAAGGAAWWYAAPKTAGAPEPKKAAVEKKKPTKYVTLDKVIVMLRRAPGESEAHYLAIDLVLATSEEKDKQTKEHLPLLRSIVVGALSGYTLPVASSMTVEQYADHLNKTFNASYAKEQLDKPFSEVMIGKLIIE
ncbi:flagellar basal body-associated FliL family protein [Massilia horti]|uniref:Flagellar protein FliL n=1 Tax=Massilia horti TaxID=2562153 RepID=A0A4Y9SSV3_9BURK|nr:flagellar basal body-associated FliL family protein [Massilia horti]TFW29691.1 flagellar basal body-associated FliL family protein [Massilia horti]